MTDWIKLRNGLDVAQQKNDRALATWVRIFCGEIEEAFALARKSEQLELDLNDLIRDRESLRAEVERATAGRAQ